MDQVKLESQISLAEKAEELAKQAMEKGLLANFSIHFYRDAWQFYFGQESDSELLTPEEAYLHLKKLLESKNK